jgi:CelD/BcsL family acetyltransferase involved in cellulose biosynthesis
VDGSARAVGAGEAGREIAARAAISQLIDPIGDARWLHFVEGEPCATIFHHPAWLALLRDQYGYSFFAPCLVDPRGNLLAGLPVAKVSSRLTGRRLVAVPFSDACEPLGVTEPERRAQLARAIGAAATDVALPLEVRAGIEDIPFGGTALRYVRHRLDLSVGPDPMERRFTSAVRRGVAKARRSGLSAERRTDPDALTTFYRLHLQTRRYQGVPTQPKRFIARFVELFREGLGFVVTVRRDDRVLAAAVFLRCGRTLTYKYGASDRRHLSLRPNNLLFAQAIEWASEEGCEVLDFGRTDLDNHGLRAFKRGWGAREADLAYTHLPAQRAKKGTGVGGSVLRSAIRHTPQSFGRLVGELLYRHAA